MLTGVEGAYEGALRAFRGPTLALLHKRDAPFVVAVLSSVFRPDRAKVPVADAHTEIADAVARLRAAGHEGLPERPAREVCRSWVDAGWLHTQVEEAPDQEPGGVEVYRLSAHAVGALEIAGRAGGSRGRVSRSRVRTLLDAVERLARDADPDVLTRMARLRREIEELQAELRRLDREGAVPQVDDETLREEAENVLALVRELPADFARVAESIKAIQRETVTSLRRDERPTGEVLRDYLASADHLMESTAEGRAFAGALSLIGDTARLEELAHSLDLVLRHPFARTLPDGEVAALRGITDIVVRGLDDVLSAQRQASRVIATQVRHHDPLRDRQVDDLLRDVFAALGDWIPESRRSQPVDALRRLPRAAVGRMRETLSELRPPQGPAPLQRWDDDGDDTSLGDAAAWGGPDYAALRGLLDGVDGEAPLADLFAAAPDGARRPVDLVGLLELAARADVVDLDTLAEVDTVRPDGTHRRLAFEGLAVRRAPATAAPADVEPDQKERA